MSSNPTESHQSKAEMQRLYREKEGEGFTELQMAIREVTRGNVDLVKRHETLTKGMSNHSVDVQSPNPHSSAAQKIRELHRQNDELRRQLNMIADSSRGPPGTLSDCLTYSNAKQHTGGQALGAWPGGATADPYAPDFGLSVWRNDLSTQYSAQYYPDNAALSDRNLPQGYTGQGRGM
ncbi:hypothetical protein DEU56DRAFT_405188 [Suillus clintonianus]|uniref:uncharacterized protein n=1 Tax=Suillus clintonianus TaxID=1904413 RepID=UPI001B875CE2|nr:uncharacterized protein DEU56DRAFT_405188 [Suillus clintonianus]KAG2134828.1 hypothetical protein DEU56DRAFT_405188 [Suillus clintonianus]